MLVPRGGGTGLRVGLPGEFEVHGQGCLVEFATGELIDFDWDESGWEVFDAWRLRRYARSCGCSESDEALVEAARSLVGDELVEVRLGWFAVNGPLVSSRCPIHKPGPVGSRSG